MPQENQYATRYVLPEMLQRATEQVMELQVYRSGQLQAPSSGTVSLLKGDGTAIVDAQEVTVSDGVATYTVGAALLPATEGVSTLWQVRWSLVMPDGRTYLFTRECWLVLRRLYPVVTQADMVRLHSELETWFSAGKRTAQSYLDAAWDRLQLRLLENGKRPNLVLSAGSLYGVHLDLTLSYTFRDCAASTSSSGQYEKLAEHYAQSYENSWAALQFTYDFDEDGAPDGDEQQRGAEALMATVVPGRWHW